MCGSRSTLVIYHQTSPTLNLFQKRAKIFSKRAKSFKYQFKKIPVTWRFLSRKETLKLWFCDHQRLYITKLNCFISQCGEINDVIIVSETSIVFIKGILNWHQPKITTNFWNFCTSTRERFMRDSWESVK